MKELFKQSEGMHLYIFKKYLLTFTRKTLRLFLMAITPIYANPIVLSTYSASTKTATCFVTCKTKVSIIASIYTRAVCSRTCSFLIPSSNLQLPEQLNSQNFPKRLYWQLLHLPVDMSHEPRQFSGHLLLHILV